MPVTPREPRPQTGEEPVPATPREPRPQPGDEPVPVTPREPGPQPAEEPVPLAPRESRPQPGDEPVPVTPREPGSQPGEEPAPLAPREPRPQPAAGPLVVPPRHQVVIVASTDVISGRDPQGRCEIPGVGPIPLSELERLACDAELFGVLFSGDGEPLWHGRGERTATDAQRRALVARDGGCVLCADEPARCEAHHVKPWAKPSEGPTDIDNLALLCGTCHRRLHNHGRVLRRGPDGTWGTAPDPRFTGRRKPVRSPGNGVRRTAASETSACGSAALEMTMKVEAQCLPQDVGRTSWGGNHRSGPATRPASGPATRPASGPAVASHLGRETTAVGTGRRPGGKQRPGDGRPP